MAGKFEVYKDKSGKFRFRLKAGNGEILAVGEAYESKAGAMHGIESIRSNAEAASLVDLTDQAGQMSGSPSGKMSGSHAGPAAPAGSAAKPGPSAGPKPKPAPMPKS